jgi:flagellar hook-length control protein FliK
MENLKLTAPTQPQAAGKSTPAKDAAAAAAADDATEPKTGFQTLLQKLMGLDPAGDVPSTTAAADAAIVASETGKDASADTALSVPGAVPPPMFVPPFTVTSPAPSIAAGNLRKLPDEAVTAAHTASSKTAVEAEPGKLIAAESRSSHLRADAEIQTAKQSISQLPETAMGALPIHNKDAAANPQAPDFAQGLQVTQPAQTPPAAPPRIDTPVGAPGWDSELGQKVVWMAGEKQHMAELHVNPPDLGPLRIRISVDDNQTNAVFTSSHSAVREAIESALPRLREVLADSGIMLGNASVTADTPRDGSAFDQPKQPQAPFAESSGTASAAGKDISGVIPRSRGNGLVDLFA